MGFSAAIGSMPVEPVNASDTSNIMTATTASVEDVQQPI
jgi:hypothetical protein